VGTFNRLLPLAPKVPFVSGLRVRGDHCHEQRALPYLLSDLRIPCVAAAQFALVEPNLDAMGSQRLRDALRSRGVLAGVA
jgi:hypothetical protein